MTFQQVVILGIYLSYKSSSLNWITPYFASKSSTLRWHRYWMRLDIERVSLWAILLAFAYNISSNRKENCFHVSSPAHIDTSYFRGQRECTSIFKRNNSRRAIFSVQTCDGKLLIFYHNIFLEIFIRFPIDILDIIET